MLHQNTFAGRFHFGFQRLLQELSHPTILALSPSVFVYCVVTLVQLLHLTLL